MHFLVNCVLAFVISLSLVTCQEYDFAAEMKRQCLVPDPVGLLDCVENKVTLPYMTSWVDCTNSLGNNVKTSTDIVNYRCKSVWEGKDLIPEVFYIKDCVIEKTGLPAKNVSAEVLGAYKECEANPLPQSIKTAPIQQANIGDALYGQRIKSSSPIQTQIQVPDTRNSIFNQPKVQLPTVKTQLAEQPQIVNRQPYSQQFFVMYPQPQLVSQQQYQHSFPIAQQQFPSMPNKPQPDELNSFQISQQRSATSYTSPQAFQPQQLSQQQLPSTSYVPQQTFKPMQTVQQMPDVAYAQQSPIAISQQQRNIGVKTPQLSFLPQDQQILQSVAMPASNSPYFYNYQIWHPQHSTSKLKK